MSRGIQWGVNFGIELLILFERTVVISMEHAFMELRSGPMDTVPTIHTKPTLSQSYIPTVILCL